MFCTQKDSLEISSRFSISEKNYSLLHLARQVALGKVELDIILGFSRVQLGVRDVTSYKFFEMKNLDEIGP